MLSCSNAMHTKRLNNRVCLDQMAPTLKLTWTAQMAPHCVFTMSKVYLAFFQGSLSQGAILVWKNLVGQTYLMRYIYQVIDSFCRDKISNKIGDRILEASQPKNVDAMLISLTIEV